MEEMCCVGVASVVPSTRGTKPSSCLVEEEEEVAGAPFTLFKYKVLDLEI